MRAYFILLATLSVLAPSAALAQVAPPVAGPAPAPPSSVSYSAPVSTAPLPDETMRARLIWSTMIAIQQANESGNYTVLRDIAAPEFQAMNDPSRLSQIFAGIRSTHIDLSETLLRAPTYTQSPTIDKAGRMHLTGAFGLRPTGVFYDLTFEWVSNQWKLFGVSLGAQSLPSGFAAKLPPTLPAKK